MKKSVLIALLAASCSAAAAAPGDVAPAPPDAVRAGKALAALDGAWILRSAKFNGQPVPDRKFSSGTWTFSSGALSATNGEGTSARFTLAADPAAPDAFRIDPVPPSTERAISMLFRLEGDRLTIAFFDGTSGRPVNFEPERKKMVLEFSKNGR